MTPHEVTKRTIRFGNTSVRIDTNRGVFDISMSEHALKDIHSSVIINGNEINLLKDATVVRTDEASDLLTIELTNDIENAPITIQMSLHKDTSFLSMRLILSRQHTSSGSIRVELFQIPSESLLAHLGGDVGSCRMLVNPFSFTDSSGMSPMNGERLLFGECTGDKSCLYSVISNSQNEQSILLGYIPPTLDRSSIEYDETGLHAVSRISGSLKVEEEIVCDQVLMGIGSSGHELLAAYSKVLPGLDSPVERSFAIAWSSWDYYFASVTEEDVVENMDAICRVPWLKEKIEYIVIDDGWQRGYGDWEASSRFHGDLKRIVKKIREHGFIPGIWVAPFLVDYYTPLGLRTPQALAKDKNGNIEWSEMGNGGRGILDPTSPDGEVFLRNVFGRLRDIGFEYFKVDFVRKLCTAETFQRGDGRKLTPVVRGMQIIREAIGSDAYLLGCGMPIQAGYGLINANRISGDISTYWSNILTGARQLATQYWMHGKSWVNDPDFLIVRNAETSDDLQVNPFFAFKEYCAFTPRTGVPIDNVREAQVWASLVILSGGIVTLGDRISMLNDKGLHLLETTLHNLCENAAIPVDLFKTGLPEIWLQEGEGFYHLVVFNWSDKEAIIHVDPKSLPWSLKGDHEVREIWTEDTRLINLNSNMEFKINRRACRFMKVIAV